MFRGIDATIVRGDVVAVVGPSGSGKSTLLSLVAGWERPAEGEITRHGVRRTRWVFQNPHGVSRRTARDHITIPLLAQGMSRADADREADALAATFGISSLLPRPFAELSGGEAQRLMLARAAAASPDLLLIDEPTAQLDMHTADAVNAVISSLGDQGRIVLVATHDARTRDACTRVLDLEEYR